MRLASCTLLASTVLALSATAADARCSYWTEATLLFAPGTVDCLLVGSDCGPYDGILDRVAELWQYGGGSGVLFITGHADTFASAEESQDLSERRAAHVRDQLAARGINSDQIVIAGRGEGDLARPTADGVVEALNNRVSIDLTDTTRTATRVRIETYRREAEAAIAAGIEPPPRPIC